MRITHRSSLRLTLLGSAVLLAAACSGEQAATTTEPGAATSPATAAQPSNTPEAAILNVIKHFRNNDINGVVTASVPAAHLDAAKAKWASEIQGGEITEEDRAQFAQTFGMLTAPGAEEQLMAQIRPQLEQFQGEMRAQLPAIVAMGKGAVTAQINESQDIPADQKPQVISLLNAVGAWAETGAFADIDRAEKAIGEVTSTARSLSIKSLDDLKAQDFNGLMTLAGTVSAGAKRALSHYDINIDSALDSVRVETISQEGDNAKVRVHATLFDTPLTFDTDLVRVDGNWYSKDTVEELSAASTTP